MTQLVEKRLGLFIPPWKLGRLAQLLLIAVTVTICCVMSIAVANSLFVSDVGADHLPLVFIFIGLCSMPAYALFSQVVDRYSRPLLFRVVLLVSIAIAIGLRLLLFLDGLWAYYILFIACFFQWDFHNNILYPSLLTDYFTSLEYKQYAPFIGIAQAVGTLLGGGLTAILSQFFSTQDLLLWLPLLFAIAGFQLFYLENSQRRIDALQTSRGDHGGILESLKMFPDLVQRYPLILFLAASSFLMVIVYTSSEFLWFNLYGQHFSDRALTRFLGIMRIVSSLVQVGILYGFTRPLLEKLGVVGMNTVYPLTTLASFLGLAFHFKLPSAIVLQLNGDALIKGINIPVHQLNYNAVPQEFLGRFRTLSDGFIYAIGLTLAGCILWTGEHYLTLIQVVWLAAGLTLLLLLVRLPMGRFYAQGLEEMIRSSTIDLDDFSKYRIHLPPQSHTAIRELLADNSRYLQIQGLELAATLGQPEQFLPEIQQLLQTADAEIRDAAIQLFANHPNTETLQEFEILLDADRLCLQTFALEVLIVNQYVFDEQKLRTFLGDSNQELNVLAAMAATQVDPTTPSPVRLAEPVWQTGFDNTTARTVMRVAIHSGNREFVPLIERMLPHANPTLTRKGLDALASFTRPGDREMVNVAIAEIDRPDPSVRLAAFNLLGIARCEETIEHVAWGLGDADPRVRQRAATALAAYGKSGLLRAKESLSSANPEVVNTAIAAIGQVRTRYASDILYTYLVPEFQQLARTRKWQQQIPTNNPGWQPLASAIDDYHQRLIQKVLYILSCLGHSRTVNTVTRILATSNQRDLANAVEVLASLSHRRFILPLMPLLEQSVKQLPPTKRLRPMSQWLRTRGYKLLLEALESRDRWIRIGALIALAMVPSALIDDPDPFVKSIATQIFSPLGQTPSLNNTAMNRLLLLKNIALFKNLSLDELLLIDQALEQEHILANETVFKEGDWSSHLYILAEGSIQIIKTIDSEPKEIARICQGQYFGEVALFDDAPHWDGAITLEDCTLLKLEKTRFISLITQRPHIILEICRFLSQRLRETDKYRSARTVSPALRGMSNGGTESSAIPS